MSTSLHAHKRAQQRGVPLLILIWLDEYGEEQYNEHGAIVKYFSNNSIRKMERDFGRAVVARMSEFFDCYKVVSSCGGTTITVGHKSRRVRRK